MPSEQVGSAYAEVGFKVNESGLNDAKSKFSSAIGDMESKAKSVGTAIGGALKTGLEVGAVSAAGIATAGLMSFKDLESAASSAASKAVDVNGKSAEQIKAQYDGMLDHVMKVSEELGASTVFTNKQVAETFDVLAAKGVKIAEVGTSQLLPFLDLAAATQSDLASVTDLVTGSINAFGLSMDDSQRVADAYAMGMNASSASMETYNYALRQGGAAAAASGMQLEEYLAIVGKLADKQYTGEQSGAALKTAMLALYNPTKAQGEVLDKLGITYDQVDPRTHSFIDTIELLKSKGADIGDFGKVFTDSSGSIMYALSEDTDGVRELTASISGSGGLAHTQAQLMLDTEKLTGAYELAKSATEGLVTSIGGALEPAAVSLLNTWTALVPAIKEFATALISGDWGKVGETIGITAEKIKAAIAGLATGAGFAALTVGMAGVVVAAATMAAGFATSAAAAIASVAGMVAAHVAGFASMVATTISGYAKMVATTASSWALMKAENVTGWLATKMAAVSSMALTVEVTLAGYAKMATGAVASVLGMAAGVAASFGAMAMNAALRLSTMTASVIGGYAKMAAGALASVAGMVATVLAGFASMAAGAISSAIGMATGVISAVAGMAASLAAPLLLITAGLAAIGMAAKPEKLTTMGKIGSDALKGLKDVASDCWAAIQAGDFSGVATRLQQAAQDGWNYLKGIDWGGVGADIATAVGEGLTALQDYASQAADYILSTLSSIDWAGVWDSLVSAWDSAIAGLSNVGSTILGYFDAIDWGTVGFKIGQTIRDAIQALSDIGSQICQYLTSADWAGAGSSITEKIRGGLDKLKEFWNEFKTGISSVDFTTAGTEIGNKIKEGLKKITTWAADIIAGIKSNWQSWIDDGGPKNLGRDLAEAIVVGAKDLGMWIYGKIKDYFTPANGATLRDAISGAIDFAKLALQTASDFVTGFANTVLTAGKGTIGAAIIEIIGGAMNDAWDGAGAGLIEKAAEWRKDAAELWEASPLDVTIATTIDWVGGKPLAEDGETRSLTYVVDVTGADITAQIKASDLMPKMTDGHLGGMTYDQSTHDYMIRTTGVTGNYEQSLTLPAWAKQLGQSGATLKQVTDYLSSIDYKRFPMGPAYKEKVIAAFVEGQKEYAASHQTAAEKAADTTIAASEEAAENTIEASEEAAEATTGAADEAADTTVEAAKATEEAALTFRQQIWKTVSDVDQVYRNTHEAVRIGLTSAGQKIAIIGEVAQKQWQEAGNKWADGTRIATENWISGVRISSQNLAEMAGQVGIKLSSAATFAKTSIETAGSNIRNDIITSANTWKTSTQISSDNLATKVSTAAITLNSKTISAADYNYNKQVAGGNWIYEKAMGAANALATAAIQIGSSTYKFSYNNPFATLSGGSSSGSSSGGSTGSKGRDDSFWNNRGLSGLAGWGSTRGAVPQWASGTVTSGPQIAVIGEDGPANPEFVIPTKTKRWDLLYAALRAYGVRGFAEGAATGEAAAGAVDPDAMAAYFSITGLASMSKQVQRIINNLKDFFRISWGIIKAEGATYWRQINTVITTEVTAFRDSAWQAILDVRNTSISSFQEILASAKDAFSGMWPGISGSVDDVKSGLTNAMKDAGSSTVDAINQMVLNAESALSAWAANWSETWSQMLKDLSAAQSQISSACSSIAAQLARINVNVNINASGGGGYGGGGGSGGMDWDFGGSGDWLAPTGDWSEYNINTGGGGCSIGSGCISGGCPDYQQAVIASTGPLATAGLGVTGGGGYGGGSGGGGWSLPPIFSGIDFFARGARVEKPTEAIIGEAGPELVIPATYTRLMDWMAGQVETLRGGGAAQRVVIEDHTEHKWYLDGKEVTDSIMDRVVKQLKLKGAVPVR